jgi:uncharacterized protein (TIGR02598 family)
MLIPIPARKRRRAFSLIEVVLALGVVAFALVAILGVFPAALSQNRRGVSDTRAAQLAKMIVATIDAQTATFSSISCFGATLDLGASNKNTAPAHLYAAYPSPNQPDITNARQPNSIYRIEIRFDNAPPIAPTPTLPVGTLNQLQIRIRGLSSATNDYLEFMYVVRKSS